TQGGTNQGNKQGKDWEQVRVKTRKWQRAGGGGVSGQRQETHGRTRQIQQQAHDNINKQEKAHVRNQVTPKGNRAGSGHLQEVLYRDRGSNTYLPPSNATQFINVTKCSFLYVFVDILSLTVKIHLPLQL